MVRNFSIYHFALRSISDYLRISFRVDFFFFSFLWSCRWRWVTTGISSDKNLLSNPTLRYSAWAMALITCSGNVLVLWGRFTQRDENRAVSLVIRNLAISDFLMGIYLTIVSIQDYRYRDRYSVVVHEWITSWHCIGTGALAMISSEVSLLILTFISIERFLLIADPFGGHRRLTTQNIFNCMFSIWLIGIMIAIIPGKILILF